jgi:hypothetical protein
MVLDAVFSKEVGISGCDHCVAQEKSRCAMVRVQAISLPRVVAEDNRWFQASNLPSETAAEFTSCFEIPIDLVEEDDFAPRPESAGRFTLFFAASRDESFDIGIGIPCPLGTIGQDEMMNHAASLSPLCQSPSASEFDVVGVSADSEGDCRRRKIHARDVVHRARSRGGWLTWIVVIGHIPWGRGFG